MYKCYHCFHVQAKLFLLFVRPMLFPYALVSGGFVVALDQDTIDFAGSLCPWQYNT